jgi:hypothetical protein
LLSASNLWVVGKLSWETVLTIHKSEGHHLSHSWQQSLAGQRLEGYFDVCAINKKWHIWISLGLMKKKVVIVLNSRQDYLPFTPETQFLTFFKIPPHLPKSNFALLKKQINDAFCAGYIQSRD